MAARPYDETDMVERPRGGGRSTREGEDTMEPRWQERKRDKEKKAKESDGKEGGHGEKEGAGSWGERRPEGEEDSRNTGSHPTGI